jgi:hypothetical protein
MKFLIILFIILSFNCVAQTCNLSNTLGFNYSDNQIKTYSGSFISSNTYEKKWFSVNNSLNENITYSGQITQHELANKLTIGLSEGHHSAFINFQTNYSLTRNLNVDNLFGIGYGRRDSIDSFKVRYSYAILYEKINNTGVTYLRHSVRVKLSQNINRFSWSSEYYFQPYIKNINNNTLYGTTSISYKLKNVSISIVDVLNYNSVSHIKVIHSLSLGLTYQINKTKC